ncbi:MAG TPA: acetylornithine/succinylornithine family transaminase [Thermoanaerobaculia bacterium]|nr:acetylornithine/succinylornithine family transaminase [Thermoanaerobaculia bacterium]
MHQPPHENPSLVEKRDAENVLGTYKRTSFHPRAGKGAKLVDADGKVYWDLLAGIAVNALGHRHPRLVKALREEASRLLHVSNLFYHPAQGLLAERLARLSGMPRVFFCNSGTEAIEAAVKFTRLATPGRSRMIALEGSFHGRTMGALALTGNETYRTPFEPLVGETVFLPANDIPALESAVTPDTAGIFLEPILGEGGIVPLTPEYVRAARAAADRVGAALVFDEVQSGLGRTGHFFVFQELGVVPDLVALAKPLGGGLPLGAVLVGGRIAPLVKPGHHGTTFGGNPVACRLGLEVLSEIADGGLLEKIRETGEWFGKKLRSAKRRSKGTIVDVRGRGLMWGVELDRDAAEVQRALLQKGFVVGTSRARVLRLLPPYVVPRPALSGFVRALEEILREPPKEKVP